MSTRRSLFNGTVVLGVGQCASHGLFLVRSIIVARMLSVSDYGIAGTFLVTVQFLESLTDLGASDYLIQSRHGDDERALRTAHAVLALRAALGSIFLFAAASPVAILFGIPDATWAFQCLALWPLINGVTNLDLSRPQRRMQFRRFVAADLISNGSALVAAWPLAYWFRDYSAMLWLLLLQRSAASAISFVLAERSYRWAWHREYVKDMLRFGWPLLVNGALMYLIFQGDRLLIGVSQHLPANAAYTLSDLALYSVALGLSTLPISLLVGILNKPLLPLLAAAQDERTRFLTRYQFYVQALCLVSGIVTMSMMLLGGELLVLFYGTKYDEATGFYWILAASQGLRLVRVAPVTAAQALGDNKIYIFANLARVLGLAGAATATLMGLNLAWLAASSAAGELLAVIASLVALRIRHRVDMRLTLVPFAIVVSALTVTGIAILSGRTNGSLSVLIAGVAMLSLTFTCATLIVARQLRAESFRLLAYLRPEAQVFVP